MAGSTIRVSDGLGVAIDCPDQIAQAHGRVARKFAKRLKAEAWALPVR